MTDFSKVIKAVDEMFQSSSVYSTYVSFNVGNFSINTASSDNNYFMSLENDRNGSGQANKFTLSIVFVPKILDAKGITDADIIDKQLTMLYTVDKDREYINNRKCYIQYGYGNNDTNLFRTIEYEGTVLDYTVEINDGALFYTIIGISGAATTRNEKLYEFPSYDEPMKPSDEFRRIVDGTDGSGSKYLPGYTFDSENSICDDIEVSISGQKNVTVFQYLETLTTLMKCETDDEEMKHTYGFIINDAKNNKSIYIAKFPESENPKAEFIFDWMNPIVSSGNEGGGNIVQDFKTSFSGAVLYSRTAEEFFNIDQEGNVVETETETKPSVADVKTSNGIAETTAIQEEAIWARAIQSSYKATLTLVGIPCEIKIGSCIKVVPLILGKAHHTQGLYMITKITDRIDSSGYVTILELLRLQEEAS